MLDLLDFDKPDGDGAVDQGSSRSGEGEGERGGKGEGAEFASVSDVK